MSCTLSMWMKVVLFFVDAYSAHYWPSATVSAVTTITIHSFTAIFHDNWHEQVPDEENNHFNPLMPTVAIRAQQALLHSALSIRVPRCQKLVTNDGLTLSGTGCFIPVAIWQQWASKG